MDRRHYALLLALVSGMAHAEFSDERLEADCAKIPTWASQGETFYKAKNYGKAREAFVRQVAWSENCGLDDKLIATAYNNVALTWIRQGEWRKARAWLMLTPDDEKSVYNLALIKDKLDALSQSGPAGEYWRYAGLASWNVLQVKPAAKKADYQIDFQGYYMGLMGLYSGPNMGEFSERVTIQDDKAIVAIREGDYLHCDISLTFSPETIDAETDDVTGCGFGMNVTADGHYLRVDE